MDNQQKIIAANTKFAFTLWQEIIKQDGDKNVFISPSSIVFALIMTYNGAEGATKQEIAQSLELLGMTTEEINSAYQAWQHNLTNADPEVKLLIANSLWVRQGLALNKEFINTNQQFLAAQVSNLDFTQPESTQIINDWVKEQTNDKINQIIDNLEPYVLLLINAIYFKGNWQEKFDQKLTTDKPFYLKDGNSVSCPTMSQYGEYLYWENEQFQMINLPYGQGSLGMDIFLPHEDSSLSTFYQQLNADNWHQWSEMLILQTGLIELPRFQLEYEKELKAILTSLGIESMFESRADFSKMTDDKVVVDQVKHKTFVEVNEEGTEAAGITAGMIARSASASIITPFEMKVNRPFFFIIRDLQTGTILFMGSIVEPKDFLLQVK